MYQPMQPMYSHRRPKRLGSYFLPLLSLIIIGLIGVLAFQIFTYYREKQESALQNKAAVKIVTGRAEMKIWGVDQWANAVDGSILNEGDQIRTAPGSRLVLSLLNGSVVRLNSDTEVELSGLKSLDGEDEAEFTLKSGEVWLKHSEKDTVKTTFAVFTTNLNVQALGTTFDVAQSAGQQSVHVVDGKVNVDVQVQDADTQKMRTAESVQVALGQEVSLGSSEINDLLNQKPLDLLALLSDDFRNSEWYTWNRSEDSSGASSVSVADAVNSQQGDKTIAGLADTTPAEVTEVVSSGHVSAPVITSPAPEDRTVKSGPVFVIGTVSAQTDKVEVTSYNAVGKPDPYILSKYVSGSTNWSYSVSDVYGNLRPGVNRYLITAIGKDGTRSFSTEIIITYDKPQEPADLAAPTVVSFNDSSSSEVETDSVKVSGTIGRGIAKVYVNGFVLTRYVMDSGTWTYFARSEYGNLKDGENTYEIYGVDLEGNKTPVTKFTITKKAAPAPEPTPAPAPAPEGTPAL